MLRVVLASVLAACLSACSVGYVSLPFPTSSATAKASASEAGAKRALPGNDAAKTGLGGPKQAAAAVDAAAPVGLSDPGALDLINELRFGKGLKPLEASPALTRAAQMQAANLARSGTLTHVGPDGSTPLDRVRMTGFQPAVAAENVAGGQENVVEAIRSWRESDAHLRNMLLPDATHMGLAQVADQKTGAHMYWVLVLAAQRKG